MIETIDLLKDLHLAGFNFCFQCHQSGQYYNLSISDAKKKKTKVISSSDINEISFRLKKFLKAEETQAEADEDEDLL